MKIGEKEKIASISATAVWEGSSKVAGTIAAIKKLMGTLRSEAQACWRDSPAPFQTTRNTDNLDALSQSLQYLVASAKGLQDALQRGLPWG